MYTCPVCSYDELTQPPSDWSICPCCGVEFEYDDCNASHEELRERWLANGAEWWSDADKPPADWDTRLIQVPRGKWQELLERLEEAEDAIIILSNRLEEAKTGERKRYTHEEVWAEIDAWDNLSSEALTNFGGSLE